GQGEDLLDLLVHDDRADAAQAQLLEHREGRPQRGATAGVDVQEEPSHPGQSSSWVCWSRRCRGRFPLTADSIMSQASASSTNAVPCGRRCRKYSRLPSCPGRLLGPTAAVLSPTCAAASATSRT